MSVLRFKCPKCGRITVVDLEKNPRMIEDIDKDGNLEQRCGQTNEVEKCKPIKG